MLAHLKTTWKLALYSGLFIYFIRCSATQVKMGMDQQGAMSGLPMKNDPVANRTMPTGHEFDHIDPIKTPVSELIQWIHLGMQYVNGLVQMHPTFTKTIIPEEILASLCKSKDTEDALVLLRDWAKSNSVVKAIKNFIVWTEEIKSLINNCLKKQKTIDTRKTKIASCFKHWRNDYTRTIKQLIDTSKCTHNYRSYGTRNGHKRYHCTSCKHILTFR